MPELSELADLLVECRVVTAERWDEAVEAADAEFTGILDHLAEQPPYWWDGKPPAPPGLTDYQRNAIEDRFEADELDLLRRDLALNRFLLLDKLGQGGQGEVYRGRQLNPSRFVAVKTLIRETEGRRRRFEQEARVMMKIQHPAVARFYLYERVRDAAGEPTDEYLIAMEFVNGTDLFRLVRLGRKNKPVPWQFAVHWAVELLEGLSVIHQHGFIHRDVKPENVMIVGPAPGPDVSPTATTAKLLDFGAVKQAGGEEEEATSSTARVFIGTREYAPPEQWTGEVVAASDLYTLGGTIFFMLTGRYPYQKPDRDPIAYMNAHLREDVPDILRYNPDVPAELNRVCQRMMAKDPEDRGTAAELIDSFRQFLPGTGRRVPTRPNAPPPTPAPRTPAPVPLVTSNPSRPTPRTPEPVADQGLYYRIVDPFLAFLERVFIPGHHRPPRGQEPAFPERALALLRRPLLLIILAVLFGLLIYLVL